MRRSFLHFIQPVLLFFLLFTSCRKHDNPITDAPLVPYGLMTVSGLVESASGMPVFNAEVFLGKNKTYTDQNGLFSFRRVIMEGEQGVVIVKKRGYFSDRRVIRKNGLTGVVFRFRLIDREESGSLSATAGGTIQISNGGSVVFTANSFVDKLTNQPYTGTVKVFGYSYDPTDMARDGLFPGSIMAHDSSGNEKVLASYAMMNVELEGSSGQQLQLAAGKNAEVRFFIPSALQNGPATIPLWYLNDSTGTWKEEGSATKQGGLYKANVRHFTTWNCDIPFDQVMLTIPIEDSLGQPVPFRLVTVSMVNSNFLFFTAQYTDANGVVTMAVAKGFPLQLQIRNECGANIFSRLIGSFNTHQTLPRVVIPADPAGPTKTITGTALNTDSLPVAQGFVILKSLNKAYRGSIVNGKFSVDIPVCLNGFYFQGLDEDRFNEIGFRTIIPPPSGNIGTFYANMGPSFFEITLPGNVHKIIGSYYLLENGNAKIFSKSNASTASFKLRNTPTGFCMGYIPVMDAGYYIMDSLEFKLGNSIYRQQNPVTVGVANHCGGNISPIEHFGAISLSFGSPLNLKDGAGNLVTAYIDFHSTRKGN